MRDEKENNRTELTRRGFLKGIGAGAVIATGVSAGTSGVFAAPSSGKMPKKWNQETDVIIVGFGGAGASAALEADKAGAKGIILEKMAKEGGSTRLSGGVVVGAGTSIQKAAGVEDSPENLYQFLMAVGGEYVDPGLVKVYASESGKNIEWLIGMGLEFPLLYFSGVENVPKYASISPPKRRGHITKGGGAQLFAVLRGALEERKVKVLRETPAVEVIMDSGGEVVGVKALSKGKELYIHSRKAVVLATGGFGRNKEMLRAYSPMGYEGAPTNALGITGDGLRMAQALGADLMGVYAIVGVPTTAEKPSMIALYMHAVELTAPFPCVAVNKSGKRFANETLAYEIFNIKIFQQEDSVAWTIFDEEARRGKKRTEEEIKGMPLPKFKTGNTIIPNYAEEGLVWSEEMTEEIEKGIVLKGETFGELAEKIKVDRQTFEKTMNEYNGNAKMGKDPEFGKSLNLGPLESPPFYAIKTKPGMIENLGGLRIDTKARVLNVFGKIIPRLYAAGAGLTGGLMGEIYPASGMCVGPGITFGRIAGRNAAGEKGKGENRPRMPFAR